MMKPVLIALFLAFFAVPATADAASVRDTIVNELKSDGYEEIRISRTWLGRTRFIAEDSRRYREIVVNPITGVILRDYTRFLHSDDDDDDNDEGREFEEEDDDEDDEEDDDPDDDDDDPDDDDDDDDDDKDDDD